MNYIITEKYFDENKYEELLDAYKEELEMADQYANLFTNNALVTPYECQEALEVLTGLYMKFNTVFHIAEYQYEKKKQISKISTGDTESLTTIYCLRIKAIFKAYTDNTKKAILTSQSQLKYFIKEMELTK